MNAAQIAQPAAEAVRLQWTTPQVECLETAPEVTAYAGKDEPWIKSH